MNKGDPTIRTFIDGLAKAAAFKPDLAPDKLPIDKTGPIPLDRSQPQPASSSWLDTPDPNGWQEWYRNYSDGRRDPSDTAQMRRWYGARRHLNSYIKSPTPRRGAMLQSWAIDAPQYLRRKQRNAARESIQAFIKGLPQK